MYTFIIIFCVSILGAFGMIFFRVWQIRKSKVETLEENKLFLPKIPFRYLEKNVLYFIKHILQGLIFIFAKYWFVITNKFQKWFNNKWPKINSYFTEKPKSNTPYRHSFLRKAILESKAKIRGIKEKVKEETK